MGVLGQTFSFLWLFPGPPSLLPTLLWGHPRIWSLPTLLPIRLRKGPCTPAFPVSLGHAGPSLPQGVVLDGSTWQPLYLHRSEVCPEPAGWGTCLPIALFDGNSYS